MFFIKAGVLVKVPKGESLVTYGGAGAGRQTLRIMGTRFLTDGKGRKVRWSE